MNKYKKNIGMLGIFFTTQITLQHLQKKTWCFVETFISKITRNKIIFNLKNFSKKAISNPEELCKVEKNTRTFCTKITQWIMKNIARTYLINLQK